MACNTDTFLTCAKKLGYKIGPPTASYLLHNHVSVNTEQALGVECRLVRILCFQRGPIASLSPSGVRSNDNAGSAMPASQTVATRGNTGNSIRVL